MALPAIRFRVIERPRLRADVCGPDGGIAPLTLFLAPAGMGKTVLASQWVRSEALESFDVRWVRAPGPGSGGAFWERLRDGLAIPVGRDRLGAREDVRRWASRLTRDALVVVDDFQHVSSAQLDLDLAALLELSEHLYLAVLSRRFTALDGPLVTSHTTATVIDAERLAFTEAETIMLAEAYGVSSHEALPRLQELTNGWPVAVRIVVQEIGRGGDGQDLAAQLSRFVVQHMQAISAPEGTRALLLTALCDGIGVDLLGETVGLGFAETAAAVEELCELGLAERTWYTDAVRLSCHPGFVGTLRSRARQVFGAEEAVRIQRRHALDLSRDEPVAGVRQLVELGFLDEAERVGARYFLQIVDDGAEMLPALRRLPQERLRDHPVLIGLLMLIEMQNPAATQEELDRLQATLRESARRNLAGVDAETRLSSLALLTAAERMRGEPREALRLARDLEQRVMDESDRSITVLGRSMPIIHAIGALAGLMNGDFGLAERGYARTIESAENQGNGPEQVRGWAGLALVAALRGRIPLAEERLAKLDAVVAATGRKSPHLSWVNEAAAHQFVDLERGDWVAMKASFVRLGPFITRSEVWPILVIAEAAETRSEYGDADALALVRRRVDEVGEVSAYRTPHYITGLLTVYAANLTMLLGNYVGAAEMLADIHERHPYGVVARARLRLLEGKHAEAIGLLDSAGALAHSPRLAVESGLVRAVALRRVGDAEAARTAFADAVAVMRENGLRQQFGLAPYDELVALAEEAGLGDASEALAGLPEAMRCRPYEPLTPAEHRTLASLGDGDRSVAGVAEALFITENTVKFHLRSIYRKLRVPGREEAVARARQMGILAP